MDYRFMGRTGLKVSELCFGTMTFAWLTDEATGHQMLDRFVEVGGTFIDTADVYGRTVAVGRSEEMLGSWLKSSDRDSLVIATKASAEMGPGPNERGSGRKHLLAAVEASLRRLGTDYIDLYQMHVYDDGAPLEETIATLDTLVRSGKVRYVGASNYTGWQLQKSIDLARHHGFEPYASLQPRYNLLDRDVELDLVPVCRNEGIGIIPFAPLCGGWLAGKYRRGMTAPVAGTRVEETWAEKDTETTWQVVDALHAVAAATERSPAQVALRWLLQRPGVTAPIIGVRSMEQLEDNLGAVGWTLTDDQTDQLTDAGHLPAVYPHDVLARYRRRPA